MRVAGSSVGGGEPAAPESQIWTPPEASAETLALYRVSAGAELDDSSGNGLTLVPTGSNYFVSTLAGKPAVNLGFSNALNSAADAALNYNGDLTVHFAGAVGVSVDGVIQIFQTSTRRHGMIELNGNGSAGFVDGSLATRAVTPSPTIQDYMLNAASPALISATMGDVGGGDWRLRMYINGSLVGEDLITTAGPNLNDDASLQIGTSTSGSGVGRLIMAYAEVLAVERTPAEMLAHAQALGVAP